MNKTTLWISSMVLTMAVVTALTACSGGNRMAGGDTKISPPGDGAVQPLQQPVHAVQSPIIGRQGLLHVGADVAPADGAIAPSATHDGIAVSFGRVRDGVGADEVTAYLNSAYDAASGLSGLSRFLGRPVVRLAEGTSAAYADYAVRAVQLVNAALPPESRILFASDPAPALAALEDVPPGEIFINYAPRETWNVEVSVEGEVGVSVPLPALHAVDPDTGTAPFSLRLAQVWIDPAHIPDGLFDRGMLAITAHELIHAIGLLFHTDPTRFPQSIMNPGSLGTDTGHLLSPVDRDALLAAYSGLELQAAPEQLAEDLGPWEDTSVHVRGSFDSLAGPISFGVAFRNGLLQPWASGPTPGMELADNPGLSQTVRWTGRLLGLTPIGNAVGATADLGVDLQTLNGQLAFTNLEAWAANAAPGPVGSGTLWGDGDLHYTVAVRGNTFVQSGGDEGTVTGAFFGSSHEAMGGVVERDDLTAGFGGKR